MKIVHRSPTALVVRDSATFARVVGVLLVAFALSTRLLRWPPIDVPVLLAIALAVTGAACLLMSADSTYAVDADSRIFSMSRRYLLRPRTRREVPLRDVVAIEIESSTDSDGDGVYRLVTRLKNGATLPWTSSYSSIDLELKREISHGAHEVMGVPAPAFRPVERPAPQSSRAAIIVAALFCIPFLGIGGYRVWREQRSLSTFRPVLATVTAVRVDEHRDSDGSSYRPAVTYRYVVDGRQYQSDRVTPIDERRGRRWARSLASRFEPGREYRAYYDPDRPSSAFLVRTRSALSWVFLALPLLCLAGLGVAWRRAKK